MLPFANTIDRVTILGADLVTVLEQFAAGLCPDASCYASTFLQMSGVRVVYNVREGNLGQRVAVLDRKCTEEDGVSHEWSVSLLIGVFC